MADSVSSEHPFHNPADWDRIVEDRPGSVLLKTARPDSENTHSCLFAEPSHILCARELREIPAIFEQIEQALSSGSHVAGFLSYEAGYHFEPTALGTNRSLQPSGLPLAWFGAYRNPLIVTADASEAFDLDDQPSLTEDDIMIGLTPVEYRDKIVRIRHFIEAGDFYQANFTLKMHLPWRASAHRLFRRMLANQRVAYGAMLNTGDTIVLSASPELFFRRHGSEITVRPMKGTVRRGRDLGEDAALSAWLAADEKNRAENIMIVDLLRNDLGRICTPGSVKVTDLFSIERYNQLFQMTSTIRGDLQPGATWYQLFRCLFPCGSITGAPKIRTMQVLRELEGEPRGIACGAIGYFAPGNRAVFSVAIRTLTLKHSEIHLRVGSGITYDSVPDAEYQECLLKSRFVTRAPLRFDLIETILWDGAFFLLDLHLDRLAASAAYFDFQFDRDEALRQLHRQADAFVPGTRLSVRLLLSPSGTISMTSQPAPGPNEPASLVISPHRTDPSDRFLRHKTTNRKVYDRAYAEARAGGFEDALFLNQSGEVTECAIHNVMIEKDGRLATPPVECGLLPGVYRRHLLETQPEIRQKVLTLDDVLSADRVFLFNSVRGMRLVCSIRQMPGPALTPETR